MGDVIVPGDCANADSMKTVPNYNNFEGNMLRTRLIADELKRRSSVRHRARPPECEATVGFPVCPFPLKTPTIIINTSSPTAKKEVLYSTHKASTPINQINEAYKCCKFGWFHVKLLAAAFVGTVASILVTCTTSYLLPTAECDLDNMSLLYKGLLNASPYLGMMVSSVMAGFLIDTFGRTFFLKLGFAGIFVFTVIGGSSQTFNMLITAKFFEGILFATAVSALVTVTSEFCHEEIRDRVMLCQSSFAAIGQTIIPAMAWGILINDWRYSFFDGYIVLNTWNFYVYAMSLWSLASFIMCAYIPESPKYLITKKKYAEAREIIIKIYVENTGNARTTFPYPDLWKNEEKVQKLEDTPITKSISHQIVVGFQSVKVLFRNPLLLYLVMLSFMNFLTMGKYNMVRLWYPQISTIIEHGDISGADLCVLLDRYTGDLRMKSNLTVTECVPTKSGTETYVNIIIIGCVCILPFFISGALVNRVGKKGLLIASSLICVAATLGLRWADSKSTIVALFSLDIAVSQCMKGLIQVQAVEFFPTTVRTLAMSIIMLLARMGTLLANILLPILLDMGCTILFFSLSGVMICITIISIFLPSKKTE